VGQSYLHKVRNAPSPEGEGWDEGNINA
jgi:hypothetical protein